MVNTVHSTVTWQSDDKTVNFADRKTMECSPKAFNCYFVKKMSPSIAFKIPRSGTFHAVPSS